jgi:hypothetical protein
MGSYLYHCYCKTARHMYGHGHMVVCLHYGEELLAILANILLDTVGRQYFLYFFLLVFFFLTLIHLTLCVCVCVCVCGVYIYTYSMVHLWRLENNLWELLFSFYQVGFRNLAQVIESSGLVASAC